LVPSAKKETCQINNAFIANFVMQAKWGLAKSGYIPDMKVTKENSMYLVTHWNLSLKNGDLEFGEFELVLP
jgi:hypothetical protein